MGVKETLSKLLPAPLREAGAPRGPGARRTRGADAGRTVGARDRGRSVVDADELRRVLPEVGAGVRRDQGEAGRGGASAAQGVPAASRRARPDGARRRGPPGAEDRRLAQPVLDEQRPVAGHGDVPGAVGIGVLGAGARRLRAGQGDMAAQARPDEGSPRPQRLRAGLRLPRRDAAGRSSRTCRRTSSGCGTSTRWTSTRGCRP